MNGTVLIIHYNRGVFPLRSAVADHLFSFRNYSRLDCVYVNVAFGFPRHLLRDIEFAAVVLHTSFLAMRWSHELFLKRSKEVEEYLKSSTASSAVKIAIPQDEFINTNILDAFLCRVSVDFVFSCASQEEWKKIYPLCFQNKVKFKTVLTGYLDKNTIERVSDFSDKMVRDIDIGYRAWKAHPSLGKWGRHKVEIADRFEEFSLKNALRADISLDDRDVFLGDDWFKFLARCKFTIGVTGGSSVLDGDGAIKASIDDYLVENPDAGFDEIHDRCLKAVDGHLSLSCISPRHLEACLTKTAQLLIEADYSGILEPNEHYFPIKRDYSNLQEAKEFIQDEERVRRVVENAFNLVVSDERVTYAGFVKIFEDALTCEGEYKVGFRAWWRLKLVKVWDWACWKAIKLECWLKNQPDGSATLVLYEAVYRWLRNKFR